MFMLADAKDVLDGYYPYNSKYKVWYFNESRDREIAETDGDRVLCNPQILWTHFMRNEPNA